MFFFTGGDGYIEAETQVWNIEQGVFVPNYDRERIVIRAGDEDVHFLHIIGDLNDYDRKTMARWCIKLPPVSYTHLDVYKRQLLDYAISLKEGQ